MKIFEIFFIGLLIGLIGAKSFGQCPPLAVSSQTINRCGGGSISIQVSANTYNCTTYPNMSNVYFKWYTVSTGGSAIATVWASSNPSPGVYLSSYTVNLSASQTYWVSVTGDNGVESSRTAITINIDNPVVLSTLPYPDFNSRCGPGPLNVTIGGPSNATYSWYVDNTTTTSFATTTAPVWQNTNITGTTTYYVSAQSNIGTCPASSRLAVTAQVNPALAPPTTGADSYRFGSGPMTLTVGGNPAGSSIQWFSSATGGSPLSTGNTLSISNQTATATYYAGSISGGNYCVSTTRKAINTYVYPVPNIVPVGASTIFSGYCPIQLTSSSTYPKYEWKNSAGTIISNAQTLTVNLPDKYTLTVYIGNPATIAYTTTPFTVINGYNTSASLRLNYIVKKTLNTDNITDECSANALTVTGAQTTITYFDGLGRTIQNVAYQASPTMKDIVQPIDYDAAGRQPKQFMPYTASSSDGNYKTDWATAQPAFYNNSLSNNADRVVNDLNPYRVAMFDNSPLNTILQIIPEGAAWQANNGHGIQTSLTTNANNEVRNWIFSGSSAIGNTFYGAGNLRVTQVLDEDNNPIWEYKDFDENVILKKTQDQISKVFLETYFVYDELGNLRIIIPPQAMSELNKLNSYSVDYLSAFTNQWLFTYKYDGLGRITERKSPGVAPVFYIYDSKDRIALMQDGNQRSKNQWSFTKYDANDREILTGIYTHNSAISQSAFQTLFDSYNLATVNETRSVTGVHGYSSNVWPNDPNSCQVLAVNYYDDYDFNYNGIADYSYITQGLSGESKPTSFAQNLLTGSKAVIMDSVPNTQWNITVNFYDKFNRAIQVQRNNHKNQAASPLPDIETTVYDFSGNPIQVYISQNAGAGSITSSTRYSYDHIGREISTWQKSNSDPEVLLRKLKYNEIGQLIEKNLHSEDNGTNFLQSVDFNYNIRGWVSYINNSTLTNDGTINNDGNDLFGMKLGYETSESGGQIKYNGSITSQRWKSISTTERVNLYYYNGTNAIQKATHGIWNTSSFTFNGSFREDSILYDLNGNIKKLYRTDEQASGMDRLWYTYDGNQLVNVSDSADATNGFIELAGSAKEYYYDNNGNLISDLNKGITVKYNYLNLPVEIRFGTTGKSILYKYDAHGTRVQKIDLLNNQPYMTYDYIGSYIYRDNSIYCIENEEGRAQASGTTFTYRYDLKDHLGNIRITFAKDPNLGVATAVEENHYYAFGMKMSSNLFKGEISNPSHLKFNGKEFQDDWLLNWYDYGSRMYDPILGRWKTSDPMAEIMPGNSPYSYCFNDPVNWVDPEGMDPTGALDNIHYDSQTGQSWVEVTEGPHNVYVDGVYQYSFTGGYSISGSVVSFDESKRFYQKPTSSNSSSSNTSNTNDKPSNSKDKDDSKEVKKTVGAPGILESMIPIWGSGKAATDDFQNGRYVWGSVNTVFAISDVFLLKSIITGIAKGGIKMLGKSYSYWGSARRAYGKAGYAAAGQQLHHWAWRRNGAIKGSGVAWWAKNQMWNLMPMKSQALHSALHGKGREKLGLLGQFYYGTPLWFKSFSVGTGGDLSNQFK